MSAQYPREYPYEGEMLTIREISERTGLSKDLIRQRLRKGWAFDKAFSTTDYRAERMKKLNAIHQVEYEGRIVTIAELAEITGINKATLRTRFRLGDRGERLTRPLQHTWRGHKWYEQYRV